MKAILGKLKKMAYGGNNRAQVFFEQHVWTDKIEVKHTSRAAELYTRLLSKKASKRGALSLVSNRSCKHLQPNIFEIVICLRAR